MSTSLQIDLRAIDNASSTISKVGGSAKSLVLGFNNLASSALNLYNMVDRVKDSQVALDRANLTVMKSAESVRDAQNNLNKVLEKAYPGLTLEDVKKFPMGKGARILQLLTEAEGFLPPEKKSAVS